MTYLELINAVLDRLREDRITADLIDTNPFYRVIGSHVNDAKDRVEDSWQWAALRGTDYIPLTPGVGARYELPNSADNHYIIKRIRAYPNTSSVDPDAGTQRNVLRQISVGLVRERYAHPNKAPEGRPFEFAVTGTAPTTNNYEIAVYPVPPNNQTMSPEYWLEIDRVNHQPTLVNGDDRLLVPSLPVYTLATALASRERGEVGGTPVSELFAIADRHLSDAIAQDSALYANELDWFSEDQRWYNTNVRQA